ncbi:MAG TPA: hypothetical protein PKM73_14535 [Verrucomicrobiota bacterium]|nr:hypothetical protein [Verrucomicrobiota bacterium]
MSTFLRAVGQVVWFAGAVLSLPGWAVREAGNAMMRKADNPEGKNRGN